MNQGRGIRTTGHRTPLKGCVRVCPVIVTNTALSGHSRTCRVLSVSVRLGRVMDMGTATPLSSAPASPRRARPSARQRLFRLGRPNYRSPPKTPWRGDAAPESGMSAPSPFRAGTRRIEPEARRNDYRCKSPQTAHGLRATSGKIKGMPMRKQSMARVRGCALAAPLLRQLPTRARDAS